MNPEPEPSPADLRPAAFATTHWSVVLRAGQPDSLEAQAALGSLYEAYAYPLYAYLRCKGQPPESAQDFVQEIFLALLRKNQLATVSPEKGRFRSYLLASANHLLANEWTRVHRQKRGGNQQPLAWDALSVEERFQLEPADRLDPGKRFEQRWAFALLNRVFDRLRVEWAAGGRRENFEALQVYLSGDHDAPGYAEAGQRIGLSEGAARVAVHRLRQRYRDLLRAEIAQTVSDPDDIEEELRDLIRALRA